MTALTFLIAAALAQDVLPPGNRPDSVIVPIAPTGTTTIAPMVETAPSTARQFVNPIPTAPEQPAEEVPEHELRVRISDLVEIDGVRSNQLQGLGLVTGLNGTGDKGSAARQALSNFIRSNHLNVGLADIDIGNVALVTVTCELKPWRKAGSRVDISVQSINGASSLFGGVLLQTFLSGVDGQIYVIAQGPVPV